MTDSIILLGPIDIDGTAKCTKDSEPYKNFTEPVFTGDAAEGGLMPNSPSGRVNVFNIYQINGDGLPGDDFGYNPSGVRTPQSGIKFGVTPCAEKIDIEVVGRNDIYGAGFDKLQIKIDNVVVKLYQSTSDVSYYYDDDEERYEPALDGVNEISETFTHNFTTPKVCGHIVDISGRSGSLANNNVGYDVKITVTLRTTQI